MSLSCRLGRTTAISTHAHGCGTPGRVKNVNINKRHVHCSRYRRSSTRTLSATRVGQIKSQIPKQQKGFSKHMSILLVTANANHWNFHFRSSAFTYIDLAVQSLPLIITESELLRTYISDG